MPLEINLNEESQTDLEETYFWYAEVSENLSKRFEEELYLSLEKISKQPLMYPKVVDEVRQYVMDNFPFYIFYLIDKKEISVVAIINQSRNPNYLKKRIRKLK